MFRRVASVVGLAVSSVLFVGSCQKQRSPQEQPRSAPPLPAKRAAAPVAERAVQLVTGRPIVRHWDASPPVSPVVWIASDKARVELKVISPTEQDSGRLLAAHGGKEQLIGDFTKNPATSGRSMWRLEGEDMVVFVTEDNGSGEDPGQVYAWKLAWEGGKVAVKEKWAAEGSKAAPAWATISDAEGSPAVPPAAGAAAKGASPVSATEWKTEAKSCSELCPRILACKAGPFEKDADCVAACESAEEDEVTAKAYGCRYKARSCKELTACGK